MQIGAVADSVLACLSTYLDAARELGSVPLAQCDHLFFKSSRTFSAE